MLNQDPPQELCMPKSEEIHQGWDFLCMCPCSLVVKLRDTTQGDGYKILDRLAN